MVIETARERIESMETVVGEVDRMVDVADDALVKTDELLHRATEALEQTDAVLVKAQEGIAAGKRVLPKVAVGLALVGVGIGVAILIRRSRAGRAAAREALMEQVELDEPADPLSEYTEQIEAEEFAQDSQERE